MSKTILITGVTGQDGPIWRSHVERGDRVVGGVRRTSSDNTWRLAELDILGDVELIDLDVAEITTSYGWSNASGRMRSTTSPHKASCAPRSTADLYRRHRRGRTGTHPRSNPNHQSSDLPSIRHRLRKCTARRARARNPSARRFIRAAPTRYPNSTPTGSPSTTAKATGCMPVAAFCSITNCRCADAIRHPQDHVGARASKARPDQDLAFGNLHPNAIGDLRPSSRRHPAHPTGGQARRLRAGHRPGAKRPALHRTCRASLRLCARTAGTGAHETGIDTKSGRPIVEIDPSHYRPAEVDALVGAPDKAAAELGWRAQVMLPELVGHDGSNRRSPRARRQAVELVSRKSGRRFWKKNMRSENAERYDAAMRAVLRYLI